MCLLQRMKKANWSGRSSNYGLSEKDAASVLKKKDKARYNHYKYYTDLDWGMASNYDLCLNSGLLGIDGCVKTIQDVLSCLEKQFFQNKVCKNRIIVI